MSTYKKLLGTGPTCFIVGMIIIFGLYFLESLFFVPLIPISDIVSIVSFIVFTLLTLLTIMYALVSLPGTKRGTKLITTGAHTLIRHPLYAAFLDFFVFGLGLFLKSYAILMGGIILLFVCGWIVEREEQFCIEFFGNKYKKYQQNTKKFIPYVY